MAERFTYERSKHPTGIVQYRNDGAALVTAADRQWRRGEVGSLINTKPLRASLSDEARAVEMERRADAAKAMAVSLVATGNFAHVVDGTPLGVDGDREPSETLTGDGSGVPLPPFEPSVQRTSPPLIEIEQE